MAKTETAEEPMTLVPLPDGVTTRPTRLLRPISTPKEVMEAQAEVREFVKAALEDGKDYGIIPGIKKPSLLKPGAEKVTIGFGCYARYRIVEQEIDHDRKVTYHKTKRIYNNKTRDDRSYREEEASGESVGLYRYVVECDIVHRDSGAVVGNCIGVCSTMEKKYVDRPRECENTALKIAEKRAHVGAVLNAFGLSEEFTQDVEDSDGAKADEESRQERPIQTKEEAEKVTADTPFPFGKALKGKTLKEMDVGAINWMLEPDRKFGDKATTDAWVKAANTELLRRSDEAAGATPEGPSTGSSATTTSPTSGPSTTTTETPSTSATTEDPSAKPKALEDADADLLF